MKKLTLLFIFIVLLTSSLLFSQMMPMKNGFYIGYHGGFYNPWNWNAIFPLYDSLNINFMQNYGCHFDRTTHGYDGGFFDDISTYSSNVNSLLNSWNGIRRGNNALFMEREKILRAAYGQLSDYQAEYVPASTHPRYGYEDINGNPYQETINGELIYGIWLGDTNDTRCWMLGGLYENEEQINIPLSLQPVGTDTSWDSKYYFSDIKTPGYKWFILPRMKIDSADAFGTPTRVCRIVIIPYDGDTTDGNTTKIDIYTDNFKNSFGQYQGEYRDIFYSGDVIKEISILGSTLNRNNPGGQNDSSKVDYRIYWYGEVPVWIDRVRVCDEWAFYLFHSELENPNNPSAYRFPFKIQEECESFSIGNHSNFGYFYIDEYRYNSIPCIAKVDSIIKSYKSSTGLVSELNTTLLEYHSGIKYDTRPTEDEIFTYLTDSKAVTDILFMYVYPFTYKETSSNNFSYFPLPPNVPLPSKTVYPGTVNYYNSTTSQNYNDTINHWFENNFYSGFGLNLCLVDQFRRAATLQKNNPDIIFCAGTQSHSYEDPIKFTPPLPAGCLREPTNEEIRVQSYMAMAYGAKIILNYAFYSYYTWNDTTLKNWGMQDLTGLGKRVYNYYGQRKFDSVSALNSKLKQIGKIMYEDNRLSWDDSRTVNEDGLPFKYINNIKSYYWNINSTTGGWDFNSQFEDIKKYWEIGVFNDNQSSEGYNYFMLVNKRCTPEINQDGDVRRVRIILNPNDQSLSYFTNWELRDMLTNEFVVIDKNNTNGAIFPYDFMPGEGRLFRLAPVMKVGEIFTIKARAGL